MDPNLKMGNEWATTWLRRHVGWSNSWQSWQERLGGLFLVAAAIALVWLAGRMTVAQLVVLWGLWVLSLAGLMRRGWLKLFGPVLFYDMIRTARRTRYIILRCLYAGFLMIVLFWVYANWVGPHANGLWDFLVGGSIPSKQMVNFAESFFYTFMVIQFVTIALLTPAYTAGAIAEEKDRKTLEFLLATDLRNREIVLSKLASRLINLTFIVLTGLPVLSLMQFLGGVDPDLLLACFAAMGVTVVSLAGFSILCSVMFKKPLHAIVFTYLGAFAYLAVSGLGNLVAFAPALARLPTNRWWLNPPVTVQDLVDWANSGNIFTVVIKLLFNLGMGGRIDDSLPGVVRDYALFHGLVAVICITWAVLRLRQAALKQSYGQTQKVTWSLQVTRKPRLGHFPMLWKEIFAEPGLGRSWLVRVIVLLLVVASFVPLAAIIAWVLDAMLSGQGGFWQGERLSEFINAVHVRFVGTMVGCLLLLAVGVRAAGSMSGERDRQTLDSLLTSPLSSDSILFAKWIGSILSVRWGWLWLSAIWGLGLLCGGLHIVALPLVVGAWLIFAGCMATLGMWFSVVCKSSLRAIIWTLLSVVALCFGHYVFLGCGTTIMMIVLDDPGPKDLAGWIFMFEVFALTPPINLGFLPFHGDEFRHSRWEPFEAFPILLCSLAGLLLWGVLGATLYLLTSERFRRMAGRTTRLPDRKPIPVKMKSRPASTPVREAQTLDRTNEGHITDGESRLMPRVGPERDGQAEPAEALPVDPDTLPRNGPD
jgi:ABC-type transport system involved in multi-copper enzyme maturation permease subunit